MTPVPLTSSHLSSLFFLGIWCLLFAGYSCSFCKRWLEVYSSHLFSFFSSVHIFFFSLYHERFNCRLHRTSVLSRQFLSYYPMDNLTLVWQIFNLSTKTNKSLFLSQINFSIKFSYISLYMDFWFSKNIIIETCISRLELWLSIIDMLSIYYW